MEFSFRRMPTPLTSQVSEALLPNARVLVVDDNPDTRQSVCTVLTPFVREAINCPPDEARNRIMYGSGNIDLILSDLRFPPAEERQRSYSPRDGVSMLQELGSKCPPCTIFTGSVSALELSRLQSAAVATDGTPAARFVLKSAGIKALTQQLEGALHDGLALSAVERARILQELPQPAFNTSERYDRTNAIALVAEMLGNYRSRFATGIETLRAQCDLESWPSWERQGKMISGEMSTLARFTSGEFAAKNTAVGTLNMMHEALGRLLFLDPELLEVSPALSKEKRTVAERTLGELSRRHKEAQSEISKVFEGYREYARGLFSLDSEVHTFFSVRATGREKPIYYYDPELRDTKKIPDPDGTIRAFLKDLGEKLEGERYSLDIRYYDREYGTTEELRQKLNFGTGYSFYFRFEGEKPGYTHFESLTHQMKQLIDAKVLYFDKWQYSPEQDMPSSFQFFIKAEDIDLEAEAAEQQREDAINVTDLGLLRTRSREVEVTDVEVPSGSLIFISTDAKQLRKNCVNLTAIQHGEILIVAGGGSHCDADIALFCYLRSRCGVSENDAFDIVQDSLRIKTEREKGIAEKIDLPWSDALKARFNDLGVSLKKASEYDLTSRVELLHMYLPDPEEL